MTLLLETLIEESFNIISKARNSITRQFEFPRPENMIKVAIGMRRSGKSYFLYQTINQLLDQNIPKEQILFINFEDDRLLPMNATKMGQLLDSFYSLYPENHHKVCYFFLDEVQNVENWHLVVRRYFDTKNVQIYLTGSSAKLLSKEINTNLRGRSLAIEITPYNFNEYLNAHKLSHAIFKPKEPFGRAHLDLLQKYLITYFDAGGFPAVQLMSKSEWRETLQGYVDIVILRDIIERHNIANITLLKYLVITLLKNAASTFSVNKFYHDIKSQGYQVGKDTIHNYLTYIEDTFLIATVSYYSASERIKQNRPKKIYAVDNGLVKAITSNLSKNHGKLFENLVYLDLRQQKKEIFYFTTADGFEVDFVCIDPKGNKELFQVTWDESDAETFARENCALKQAETELGIKGKIITPRYYLKQKISAKAF